MADRRGASLRKRENPHGIAPCGFERFNMELLARFELATSPLPRVCSAE